jgi:hypothetical protein
LFPKSLHIVLDPSDADDKLAAAPPDDLANTIAFALRFEGRKRTHDADDIMARLVAKRLVEHLSRSGYVILKKPPGGGHGAGRGRD